MVDRLIHHAELISRKTTATAAKTETSDPCPARPAGDGATGSILDMNRYRKGRSAIRLREFRKAYWTIPIAGADAAGGPQFLRPPVSA